MSQPVLLKVATVWLAQLGLIGDAASDGEQIWIVKIQPTAHGRSGRAGNRARTLRASRRDPRQHRKALARPRYDV